jgi:hypothetical protein
MQANKAENLNAVTGTSTALHSLQTTITPVAIAFRVFMLSSHTVAISGLERMIVQLHCNYAVNGLVLSISFSVSINIFYG